MVNNGYISPLRQKSRAQGQSASARHHPRQPLHQLQSEKYITSAGKRLADAVELKNKYRSLFPTILSILRLALSISSEAGSEMRVLIKKLTIRQSKKSSEIHSLEPRHLVEGVEIARFRRFFFFSFCNRPCHSARDIYLYRQGVTLAGSHKLQSRDPAPVQARCTVWSTRPHGREGGNSGGNRDGNVGGNTNGEAGTRIGAEAGTRTGTGTRNEKGGGGKRARESITS